MPEFVPGVFIILGCGLVFTLYCVIYILRLAYQEMQDVQESKQGQEGNFQQQEAESRQRDCEES